MFNKKKKEWSDKYGIAFAVYGTPAESLTHRFASIDKDRFGEIEDITDEDTDFIEENPDIRILDCI